MKRPALLLCLLSLGLPVQAADAPGEAPGLAEIRDLGRLNGRALACSHAEAIARIKTLMLQHAPKTRRYGAAFEEGTQGAFLAQTREPCQDASALSEQIADLTTRLQTVLPAQPASTGSTP